MLTRYRKQAWEIPKWWAYRECLPCVRSPGSQEFLRSYRSLQHCKKDTRSRCKPFWPFFIHVANIYWMPHMWQSTNKHGEDPCLTVYIPAKQRQKTWAAMINPKPDLQSHGKKKWHRSGLTFLSRKSFLVLTLLSFESWLCIQQGKVKRETWL